MGGSKVKLLGRFADKTHMALRTAPSYFVLKIDSVLERKNQTVLVKASVVGSHVKKTLILADDFLKDWIVWDDRVSQTGNWSTMPPHGWGLNSCPIATAERHTLRALKDKEFPYLDYFYYHPFNGNLFQLDTPRSQYSSYDSHGILRRHAEYPLRLSLAGLTKGHAFSPDLDFNLFRLIPKSALVESNQLTLKDGTPVTLGKLQPCMAEGKVYLGDGVFVHLCEFDASLPRLNLSEVLNVNPFGTKMGWHR